MKKISLILFSLLFTLTTLGKSISQAVSQKLRPRIYEAEQRLKANINQELNNRRINLNSSVTLSVDFNRIVKDFNLNPEISQGALPGLDMAPPSTGTLRNFSLSPEEILSYVQKAEIVLRGKSPIANDEKPKIEKVVKSTLETLGINNLNINYSIEEVFAKDIALPNSVEKTNETQDKFLRYLLIFAGVVILGMGMTLLLLMNGMKRLGTGISEQLKQSLPGRLNESAPTPLSQSTLATRKRDEVLPSAHSNPFKEYEEIKDQLRKIFKSWKNDKEVLLRFFSTQNRIEFVMIAIDTLEEEDRVTLKKMLSPEMSSKLSGYLRDLHKVIETNPHELTRIAQDLWRLMWLGSQDPLLLSSLSGISSLQQLEEIDMEKLMPTLSRDQFSFLLTHADTEKLAMVFMSRPKLMELSKGLSPLEHLSKAEMEDLLVKLDKLSSSHSVKPRKFQQLASHLPSEMETLFKNMVGETGSGLEEMLKQKWDTFEIFLKNLDIQGTADLLSTLPVEIANRALGTLPEVKAKRIKARPSSVTIEGLRLKKALIDELMR